MLAWPSADVHRMLRLLQGRIQAILGDRLVGLYVTGSLVTGDFDEAVSDLDLIAMTSTSLDPDEIARLGAMHREIAAEEPRWANRIEVVYLTTEGLRTFRTRVSQIAVTSPGEPFHVKPAGKDWLLNFYLLRERGVTLLGPAPTALADPIATDEVVGWVREHVGYWRDRLAEVQHRNAQVYVTLTMCRALYTASTGKVTSKRQAAAWAEQELPAWAPVIRQAVRSWREDWYRDDVDHLATLPETVRFVSFVVDRIVSEGSF